MGIAYSPPDKVVHADINATSAECLMNGLHETVTKAGWEVVEELEHGRIYLLTSPQDASLQCRVKIEDTGRDVNGFPFSLGPANAVDITFLSWDGTLSSQAFFLCYRQPEWAELYGLPPHRIRIHATPCQIFTYFPGGVQKGCALMGGIPFIDPNALTGERCADEDNPIRTAQAWWVCGDLSTANQISGVPSFRTHWHAGSYATLHNSALVSGGTGDAENTLLRLPVVQRPKFFMEAYGNANVYYPVIVRWTQTEEPLCFDPFIAWSGSHPVKIRGQLWDAFYRTQYVPWETPLTFDDLPWFSYSCGDAQAHVYSTGDLFTLYLRDPGLLTFECEPEVPEVPTGESNYAY